MQNDEDSGTVGAETREWRMLYCLQALLALFDQREFTTMILAKYDFSRFTLALFTDYSSDMQGLCIVKLCVSEISATYWRDFYKCAVRHHYVRKRA